MKKKTEAIYSAFKSEKTCSLNSTFNDIKNIKKKKKMENLMASLRDIL